MSETFRIRVEPHGKEVVGRSGETVLEALQRQFYGREGRPAFQGCRRGGCAACKVELLTGEVAHGETYSRAALTDHERSRQYILSCRSSPRSDIAIRILEREDPLARFRQYQQQERQIFAKC